MIFCGGGFKVDDINRGEFALESIKNGVENMSGYYHLINMSPCAGGTQKAKCV